MDQWLAASVAPCRFEGLLQSLFSLATLLLAAVGLYGLVAHAVTCRTREIGVRMALGAGGSEVVALMVRQGGRRIGLGLALGLRSPSASRYSWASCFWGSARTTRRRSPS